MAVKALLVAIEEGLELPTEAPRLLWTYTKAYDPSFLRLRYLGRVVEQSLIADVLAALTDPAAGDLLRDSAATVIATPEAARFVTDVDLDTLMASAQDPESAGRATQIIAARHEVSPVNTETLIRFRDTFHRNADGRVRRAALSLDAEISGSDAAFLGAMIADDDVEVRMATANDADWVAKDLAAGWALTTLNAAIDRERHPAALVTLHRARLLVWEVEGAPESSETEDPFLDFYTA